MEGAREEGEDTQEHGIAQRVEKFEQSHTMRCGNERVNVSQEKESTDEGVDLISRGL